ncbi:Uncharacterised protein [Mycobacteroides abscessus subsp. abscessus]|nr:Uncharacterised protein [Mycobacteroides abscessus subsp. abscessus]
MKRESMHKLDRIRLVEVALRVSLAAAFLSAVADRFGWWEPFGQGTWGNMASFAAYVNQMIPFVSGWPLTVIAWASTAAEVILGILLLIGWKPSLVGAVSCLLLITFGIAMALSLGAEVPLSYSVFTAASAAAAYAIRSAPPHTRGTRGVV